MTAPYTIKNGADYAQNYDIVVKWMAAALCGQTLEVLGLQTGRIEKVFGFEPVNIVVKAGRMDVIARDENGVLYHIEEQRDLCRADMYRFASQHFSAVAQLGDQVTDVILASGDMAVSASKLVTPSGRYEPVIIDFSARDGWQRLEEIRQAVTSGRTANLMELIFVPLYGKERGSARANLVEEVVRFEIELYKAEKLSDKLLAATLVMSNKLLTKERINAIWEEIKMLDIIEIALEKGEETGLKKGRDEGRDEGEVIGIQKMVMELLIAKFSLIPQRIVVQIKKIQETEVLRALFHAIMKCEDIKDFEAALSQV